MALSTAEVEYISAGNYYAQLLWMKQALLDFSVIFVNKGDIKIDGIGTDDQLADIFTKPLDESRFCKFRNELNIIHFSNVA